MPSSSPNPIFSKMEESERGLWRVNANDWQLIYTTSDWSIGAPQCLQGLGDPLRLLAGLIGRNCLRISVNTPPVKFTASDNPLNRNRPPLCSALPVWGVFSRMALNSREKSLPPEAEQDETNHYKAIMFNILMPPTGTSIQILAACLTEEARAPWPCLDGWCQQI